jgi:hypothetical protein
MGLFKTTRLMVVATLSILAALVLSATLLACQSVTRPVPVVVKQVDTGPVTSEVRRMSTDEPAPDDLPWA